MDDEAKLKLWIDLLMAMENPLPLNDVGGSHSTPEREKKRREREGKDNESISEKSFIPQGKFLRQFPNFARVQCDYL